MEKMTKKLKRKNTKNKLNIKNKINICLTKKTPKTVLQQTHKNKYNGKLNEKTKTW